MNECPGCQEKESLIDQVRAQIARWRRSLCFSPTKALMLIEKLLERKSDAS